MARVTDYELAGKNLKLTMSVATVMQIKNKFGSLETMGEKMSGEDSADNLDNAVWLLAVLSSAGAAYVKLTAGEETDGWSYEELKMLIGLDDLQEIMSVLADAMSGSKQQTVEVEETKNM